MAGNFFLLDDHNRTIVKPEYIRLDQDRCLYVAAGPSWLPGLLKHFGNQADACLLPHLAHTGLVDGRIPVFSPASWKGIMSGPGIVLVLVSFYEKHRLLRPTADNDADGSFGLGQV